MADPFTWAGIGTAASLAGGAVATGGALAKGASDRNQYQYQAGVALLNQNIAKQNAAYTRDVGENAAFLSGRKTQSTIATEKVIQSAGGLDVNSGSNLDVRKSTADVGAIDQATIRQNYAKKAYGYEVEAATKGAEATGDVIAGDQAGKAGNINAASSILGTAASVSSKWLQGSSVFGGANSGITTYDENQRAVGWQR